MDETQPLLTSRPSLAADESAELPTLVCFDPNGDAENPLDWPRLYKWGVVSLLALMGFTVSFTCISVVPIATQIVSDLDGQQSSKTASVLLVTIWELGEALGPLVVAPMSEKFGRYPVINVANTLFVVATVVASLAPNSATMIFARFLTGLSVSANVLNPAIIGDMFIPEQRGAGMSIIMLAPLFGGAIGPAISGAMVERFGWRSSFWLCAGLAGVCETAFLTCFRETYQVAILERRAAVLRRETGDGSLRTAFHTPESEKAGSIVETMLRPIVVLTGSGVLVAIAIYASVDYTFFYIMSTTLPDILEDRFGLTPARAGLAFMTFSAGSFISIIICNILLDRIYIRLRKSTGGADCPEHRLPLAIFGAIAMPVAIACYGWAAQSASSLLFQLLALGSLGGSITFSYVPIAAYVVDAFGLYAASAMTAVIVVRCLMGTFLPLTTGPLVGELGYGWAFTVLAGICAGLGPLTLLVMRYGTKWRQLSPYSRDA